MQNPVLRIPGIDVVKMLSFLIAADKIMPRFGDGSAGRMRNRRVHIVETVTFRLTRISRIFKGTAAFAAPFGPG